MAYLFSEEVPENQLLLTWTGEDIKNWAERENINLTRAQLQWLVDRVAKNLENCECWQCIGCAIDEAMEKLPRKK